MLVFASHDDKMLTEWKAQELQYIGLGMTMSTFRRAGDFLKTRCQMEEKLDDAWSL